MHKVWSAKKKKKGGRSRGSSEGFEGGYLALLPLLKMAQGMLGKGGRIMGGRDRGDVEGFEGGTIMIPGLKNLPVPFPHYAKKKGGRDRGDVEGFEGGTAIYPDFMKMGPRKKKGGRDRGDVEGFEGGAKSRRSAAAKKRAGANPWLKHVAIVKADNPGVPYKSILQMAKTSYHG
jgi:hypothetical protein